MNTFNVLAVDDEPDVLRILDIILQRAGFGVFTADNAKDAFDILNDESIHVILLDVKMPETDGFSLLEKLKTDEELKKIPVIMVTGEKEIRDFERGQMLGVSDYITKPFRQELLLQRIRRAIYYSMKGEEPGEHVENQ